MILIDIYLLSEIHVQNYLKGELLFVFNIDVVGKLKIGLFENRDVVLQCGGIIGKYLLLSTLCDIFHVYEKEHVGNLENIILNISDQFPP